MSPQSEITEVELGDFIPAAHRLAKRLRQSILKARDLRRAATQARSRHEGQKACHPVAANVKAKPPKGEELRAKARRTNIAACKQMGQLLDVKSRIEIKLLRPEERFGPIREALEKLTFATEAPASNRSPAAVSFDEENTLRTLDKFEMLLDAIPIADREGSGKIELPGTLKNGQFCDRVINEIRKIRHLHPASTMPQVRTDHPDFLVWVMIDHTDMDAEDRDILFHPGRWGPVVG